MSEMTKEEKIKAVMAGIGLSGLAVHVLCFTTIFPYIAIKKAEKGEFKETCAYVVSREKAKYSYDYTIRVDGGYYIDRDIFPIRNNSVLKKESWNNIPIKRKRRDFLSIEPNICKKVQYVEVYNIFGFKKFYLYDYLN